VKALTFTLIAEPPERLDLSPLTPERLAGLDKASIARLRLGQSKRAVSVGDVFRFAGSELDTLVFDGGSARFDLVGAGMTAGSVHVIGDVGAQAGRGLHGGTIRIDGSAGPHAGSAMRGGRLEIAGNAGDDLAAPLAGELAGMAGGALVVHGRAGARAGDRMRRGLVAVLRGAGENAGCRMVAGTLVVAGGAGPMPGMLMRRGSILLDRAPAALSPSFVESGAPDSVFARLVDRHLWAEGITRRPLFAATPRRFGGDNAVLGLGEVVFPRE
jgi:formylmethanofuran dehydrogenase subunit C